MNDNSIADWGTRIARPTLEELSQQDRDVHRLESELPDDKSLKRIAMKLGISFDEVRASMRRLMARAPSLVDSRYEFMMNNRAAYSKMLLGDVDV